MAGSPDAARQFAVDVLSRLRNAGYQAYWAGGCVRDLLLGQTPKDYDVATDARPEQVRAVFGHSRTRAVGASFGVILVHGPGAAGDVEVATFRSEGPYLDGRRPAHVVYCTAEEDAHRRDFTINGMFYDPLTRQVLDYVDGQSDLQKKVIRAIREPLARFREDKLRLLRAIRFAATLKFALDPATAAAVREMASELTVVSAERIAQEWKRMLNHPHRLLALQLAAETHLLRQVFPESAPLLADDHDARARWSRSLKAVELLTGTRFELVLATWLNGVPGYTPEAARAMCLRLRLSNEETDRIVWLESHAHALECAPQFALSRLKRLMAHPYVRDLLALARARAIAEGQSLTDLDFCENYLQVTPSDVICPPPLITGDDLIRNGLRPGKQFKRLLEALRDAQLENRITTFDEALQLALELNTQSGPA